MKSSKQQDLSTATVKKQTSSTMQEISINYKEFEKNYSRELLIMDCLDWLKDRPYDAKEILDHLEYCSSIEKIDAKSHPMDQIL